MTYLDLLHEGTERLTAAGDTDAKTDAWLLFVYARKQLEPQEPELTRSMFYLQEQNIVTDSMIAYYSELLMKRQNHIPVQYLTGEQELMGFTFQVHEDVLIPRFDTELLIEHACKRSKGKRVLELCTGTGCIAISIALLGAPASVTATDISETCIELACANATRLHADIDWHVTDLYPKNSLVKAQYFDLLVSNPPYIRTSEIKLLSPEVQREPRLALDGGEDGLSFYRRILHQTPNFLSKGAEILFEIGFDQAQEVSALLTEHGFTDIMVKKDLSGLDRVIYAKRGQ